MYIRGIAISLLLTIMHVFLFASGQYLVAQEDRAIDMLGGRLARQALELDSLTRRVQALEALRGDSTTGTSHEILRQLLMDETQQTEAEKHLTSIYDDGFVFRGADDFLKIGGWGQVDIPIFAGGHPGNTEFLIRRVRLDLRGSLENYFAYRLMSDFAGSEARLQEVWVGYDRYSAARIRVGQFKIPFSLEALNSALWLDFVEPSMVVSSFQPAEDLGGMFFGDAFDKRVDYAAAVFNGRGKNKSDTNDEKDYAARLTLKPFAEESWISGLYLSGSLNVGDEEEKDLGGTGLSTAGRTKWLTYAPGVVQDGDRTRWGADLEWLLGSSSIKAEWLGATLRGLSLGESRVDADFRGWYAAITHLITGERMPRNKTVIPKADFDLKQGGWGAWEITARYEGLAADAAVLDDLATGSDRAHALTVGFNWWPNKHVKTMVNFVRTAFDDPVVRDGQTLRDEKHLLMRFQFNF